MKQYLQLSFLIYCIAGNVILVVIIFGGRYIWWSLYLVVIIFGGHYIWWYGQKFPLQKIYRLKFHSTQLFHAIDMHLTDLTLVALKQGLKRGLVVSKRLTEAHIWLIVN